MKVTAGRIPNRDHHHETKWSQMAFSDLQERGLMALILSHCPGINEDETQDIRRQTYLHETCISGSHC